jgi:hypothetical protein
MECFGHGDLGYVTINMNGKDANISTSDEHLKSKVLRWLPAGIMHSISRECAPFACRIDKIHTDQCRRQHLAAYLAFFMSFVT